MEPKPVGIARWIVGSCVGTVFVMGRNCLKTAPMIAVRHPAMDCVLRVKPRVRRHSIVWRCVEMGVVRAANRRLRVHRTVESPVAMGSAMERKAR